MKSSAVPTTPAYLRGNVTQAHRLSLLVALLAAGLSLAGLLFPAQVYPTEALRNSLVPNDVVNLLVGLPALLISMVAANRGRLAGLLCWPGALLYFFYNSTAYAVALDPGLLPVLQAGTAGLSLAAILLLVRRMNAAAVKAVLQGRVAERWCGGVLAGFGALFILRSLGVAFSGGLTPVETGVLAADILTTPVWLAGGVLLWLRKPAGYLAGLGLLFQASALFVGLEIFFMLQPLLNGAPYAAADALVILVMGLVVFVPFSRCLVGVIRADGAG